MSPKNKKTNKENERKKKTNFFFLIKSIKILNNQRFAAILRASIHILHNRNLIITSFKNKKNKKMFT